MECLNGYNIEWWVDFSPKPLIKSDQLINLHGRGWDYSVYIYNSAIYVAKVV